MKCERVQTIGFWPDIDIIYTIPADEVIIFFKIIGKILNDEHLTKSDKQFMKKFLHN